MSFNPSKSYIYNRGDIFPKGTKIGCYIKHKFTVHKSVSVILKMFGEHGGN